MAAEQKKAIREQKKELDKVLQKEAELGAAIQEEELDLEVIRKKFDTVQEEYDYKTGKLQNIWMRCQQAEMDLH